MRDIQDAEKRDPTIALSSNPYDYVGLSPAFDRLVERIGYQEYIRDGSREGEDRWNNVMELRAVTRDYNLSTPGSGLAEFLEKVGDQSLLAEEPEAE